MTMHPPSATLTRLVAVDALPADGLVVTVEPDKAERLALAQLNGLVALASLRATLRLRPEAGGVRVTGDVVAAVTQTCVVSLEPFDAAVREAVDVMFLPASALETFRAARAKAGPAADDDEEAAEEPDLIENGRIDVGALAAEHLTLGLDPYPRRPGASLAVPKEPEEAATSPFAVLRASREGRS